MITLCPSCQTHFRVHAEQLAARAGQVRCGKCGRVFDALEYLIEEIGTVHEPAVARESTTLEDLAATVERIPEPMPARTVHASGATLERAIDASADSTVDTTQAAPETTDSLAAETALLRSAGDTAAVAAGAGAFDFGPLAAADAATRTRRWPWLLGALLSLALLLAQAAYYYRSALMVLLPQTKPYAAILCAALGCDLPLPRRIELMSIEASDLQADTTNPNVMVLSATLKNRAVFDQQLPLLELTLTDAQDQPVVRRVLAPQDYIGKTANVGAGFAASSEIAIKVFIEGSQVKATGYRLYLFYP